MGNETTRQQEKCQCQEVSLLQCNTTPGVTVLLMLLTQVSYVCGVKSTLPQRRVEWTRERDRQISPSEQTPLILLLLNPSVDLLIFGWPTCDFRHEAWECSLHIYLTIRQAYSHAWTPIDLIFKMSTHAWLFGLIFPTTPSFMEFKKYIYIYLWCLPLALWGKNVRLKVPQQCLNEHRILNFAILLCHRPVLKQKMKS